MASPLTLYPVLTLLVTQFVSAIPSFDPSVCSAMKSPAKTEATSTPTFYDRVYFFTEEKIGKAMSAPYQSQRGIDEYYARTFGRITVAFYSQDHTHRVWLSPMYHQVLTQVDDLPCNATVFMDRSQFYHVLRVSAGGKNNTMASLQEFMQWNVSADETLNYIGKGVTPDRGIPAQVWESCNNDSFSYTTMYTKWYFSDPDKVQMPSSPTSSIILKKINSGNGTYFGYDNVYREESRDFTHLTKNVFPVLDPHFDIPIDMLCWSRRPAFYKRKLPHLPTSFQYSGQKVRTTVTNDTFLENFKLTILGPRNLTIQDSLEMNPYNTNASSHLWTLSTKVVSDFTTGLQYNMDETTGRCSVGPIDSRNPDAYQLAGKLVSMKTPTQFFDLDSDSYQYMGAHYDALRGIESDVYSAKFTDHNPNHQQNTLYSWYFATMNWMYYNGLTPWIAMPVRLEKTSQDGMERIHFFEWTGDLKWIHPDVSMCFDYSQEINVELALNGRYDQLVTPNRNDFWEKLIGTIMQQSGLNTYIRVAQLNVQPGNDNTILVQFKLLDTVNAEGHLKHPISQISSSQAYQSLQSSVAAGKFHVKLSSYRGKQVIHAVKNSVRTLTAGNIQSPFKQPQTNGYSSGSMAGIAIGLVLVGLLAGFLSVFVYKRFKGNNAMSFSVKGLVNEQEN